MQAQRITKRTVNTLQATGREFTVWDDTVSGFGVRVRPTGAKSYVVVYRAAAGRGAPVSADTFQFDDHLRRFAGIAVSKRYRPVFFPFDTLTPEERLPPILHPLSLFCYCVKELAVKVKLKCRLAPHHLGLG